MHIYYLTYASVKIIQFKHINHSICKNQLQAISILILLNIHDHAYAHITLSINISQEFKHINHGDISISKYVSLKINQ